MSDNHLRCALVYRLDCVQSECHSNEMMPGEVGDDMECGGPPSAAKVSPTLLAKHDHASRIESHTNRNNGEANNFNALYGGRDKKAYTIACTEVIKNDPPIRPILEEGYSSPSIGGFKVVQSDVHQIVYGTDADGLCVAVVTGKTYPSRVAIQLLIELREAFVKNFALQFSSATTDSLSNRAKPMISSLCKNFANPGAVDLTTGLHEKVDEVKCTMHGNIVAMLANIESVESLQETSEQLCREAEVFQKTSGHLKKQMRIKHMKVTILLICLALGILAIILFPLSRRTKNQA